MQYILVALTVTKMNNLQFPILYQLENFNLCNIYSVLLCSQAFVIFVTMSREAIDDYRRYRRDKEANSQKFKKLTRDGIVRVPSSQIQVGHLVILEKVST